MNELKLFTTIGITAIAATLVGGALGTSNKVVWQYDKYREEAARVKAQEAFADEFSRTNTNPALGGVVVHNFVYQWQPKYGDIELGWRDDGVVVWREVPEGKR